MPKKQTGELKLPPSLQIDQEIPEEVPSWLEDLLFEHGLLESEEEEPSSQPDRRAATSPPPLPKEPEPPAISPEVEDEDWLAAVREEGEEPAPAEPEKVEDLPSDDWLQALRAADGEEEISQESTDLEKEPATPTAEASPLAESEEVDEEELPDWLRDLEAPGEEEEFAAEADVLPDWLSEADAEMEEPPAQEEVPPLAEPEEVDEEELPGWLRDLGSPDELEEEEEVPPLRETSEPAETPEEAAVVEEGPEEVEGRELPDWLVDLRADETEQAQEMEVSPIEATEEVEEPDETPALIIPDEESEAGPEDRELPEWLQELRTQDEEMPSEEEMPEEEGPTSHPDWLTQPTTPDVTVEEGEVRAPEWLQGPVPADADESEEREDLAPDWLRGLESEAPPLARDESETPDEPLAPLDQPEAAAEPSGEEVSPFVGEDLEEMLRSSEELPVEHEAPAEPEPRPEELTEEAEGLARAEIPEWLLALRPDEAAEEPPAEVELEELSGPLKGIKGVLPAEPIIAKPHLSRAETVPVEALSVSGDLFAEVVAQPPEPVVESAPEKRSRTVAGVQRLLIYLLILAAVVVPLFIDPFQYGPLDAQDLQGGARDFYPLLEGTGAVNLPPGSAVVVAFDYHPATAGELDVQARAIVDHLMTRDLRIAAISLYPEGAALALDLLQERADAHGYEYGVDYIHLGYLPNQPASVRHFLDAGPVSADGRDYLSGEPLDGDQYPIVRAVEEVGGVSLVIELTGDERTLRAWVEQITARTRVPIAAGVTASILPYAQPYLDSGQLEALLVGLPGAAEYEAQSKQTGQGIRSLGSQVVAQAMVVLLILLGNLVHLATRGGKQ